MWFAGPHHLIEADDWPDLLPATVLGAIRQAPAINHNPSIRNLRDTGGPHRWVHKGNRSPAHDRAAVPFGYSSAAPSFTSSSHAKNTRATTSEPATLGL